MKFSGTFQGQAILVTGAGGFIGSALSKALAPLGPRLLLLLDASEQNLFELRQAMTDQFPALCCTYLLGSIVDSALLTEIFTRFRPQTVFHAAAHKHVELLESNPFAAAQTNVLGTHALVLQANHHGCQCLVFISTDKAVLPSSIMGATKRIAELIVTSLSHSACRMNAVRLGNVLGSTGSVVPIFHRQIAQGTPLTVTHPDASRYFMPVNAAIAAILTTAASKLNGRIILPELGEPVRITQLARSLMPDHELPIKFIGLRPGEKMTENLMAPNELTSQRLNDSMLVIDTPTLSAAACQSLVRDLSDSIAARSLPCLLQALASAVPEYQPSALLMSQCAD